MERGISDICDKKIDPVCAAFCWSLAAKNCGPFRHDGSGAGWADEGEVCLGEAGLDRGRKAEWYL